MKTIISCLLVFMTVPSLFAQNQSLPVGECLSNTTLSERLQFAGIDRSREILGRSDEWARQLSEFDRGVRMKTTEPTNTRDFLEYISGEAAAWTDDEQLYWKSLIDQLSEALEGMNLNIPARAPSCGTIAGIRSCIGLKTRTGSSACSATLRTSSTPMS